VIILYIVENEQRLLVLLGWAHMPKKGKIRSSGCYRLLWLWRTTICRP